MSYVPVNVKVIDSDPQQSPIAGVTVAVLTIDGKSVVTLAVTDGFGVANFLLPPDNYQLRFYKQQVNFRRAVAMQVQDAPAVNDFIISAQSFVPPISLDQRLCVGYGLFRDVTGAPAANLEIQFIAKFMPLWLEGAGLLSERKAVRTDKNGMVQINLIRCGKYDVVIQGYEDNIRQIDVPDEPNVNIPDLIFPIVSQVVFNPAGPYTLTIGTDLLVTPTAYSSDENPLSPTDMMGNVQWSTDDPTIAAVIPAAGTLTLRGFAPGQTMLRATRIDQTIVHIPDPGIAGQPVLITVL